MRDFMLPSVLILLPSFKGNIFSILIGFVKSYLSGKKANVTWKKPKAFLLLALIPKRT